VPKKFFKKPNVSGLALHQWQMNNFQITRDNNRCVRENNNNNNNNNNNFINVSKTVVAEGKSPLY